MSEKAMTNALPEPTVFVCHEATGRSGHLGHAMFQNADGELFAMYPNCTGDDNGGHSARGWMEYRSSLDGGATWRDPEVLNRSKEIFDAGDGRAAFAEKAIVTTSSRVLLYFLISDVSQDARWEPFLPPLSCYSDDGGHTWSEPADMQLGRGRIYDAKKIHNVPYVLFFRNDASVDFFGVSEEHKYVLYTTDDDGITYREVSTLPFDATGRCYGTICDMPDGHMIAYLYDKKDEYSLDYCISSDGGRSWSSPAKAHFAKRLRNPQIIRFNGRYYMHGRSGSFGPEAQRGHIVLYTSEDGVHWDDGRYLAMRTEGNGAYSNSLVVTEPDGRKHLRIQSSHAYREHRTNVLSWRIDDPGN